MIHRDIRTPGDPEWFEEWRRKADAARDAVNAAFDATPPGERFQFDFKSKAAIWSEFKSHLIRLFEGKCAYCESKILHVDVGDVEHYRPKSRVQEDPNHPGYYWLAFRPENYYLACKQCNTYKGKKTQFPVADESRRVRRRDEDLNREEPLLLSPYHDDPAEHLEFDVGTGFVKAKAKSTKGAKSIEVYQLNRPELVEARRQAQVDGEDRVLMRIARKNFAEALRLLREIREGNAEYSAALRVQVVALMEFCGEVAEEDE